MVTTEEKVDCEESGGDTTTTTTTSTTTTTTNGEDFGKNKTCEGDEGSEVKRDVTKTNRELEFGCGDGCIKMKGVSIYEND